MAVSAAAEKIEDDLTTLPASLDVVAVKFDNKRPDALLLEYFGRAEDGLKANAFLMWSPYARKLVTASYARKLVTA